MVWNEEDRADFEQDLIVYSIMATSAAPSPIFNAQERVLCYHGPLIYEAKVLKTKNHDENTSPTGVAGPRYLVHYKGWKQTYAPLLPLSKSFIYADASFFICL